MLRYDIFYHDRDKETDRPIPLIPPPGAIWAVCTSGQRDVLAVVGERWLDIRAARRELGWSVEYVAERCAVTARTVKGWERGRLPGVTSLDVIRVLFD